MELGFQWLREGRLLEEMDESGLLAMRVHRIFDAISIAGLDETFLGALAAATLACGAPLTFNLGTEQVEKPSRIVTLWGSFGLQPVQPDILARLYPIDAFDLRQKLLPPVRPEAIGQAFVRAVLRDLSDLEARRVVETAWNANPTGTLRSILLIDPEKRGGDRNTKDPLLACLSTVPPATFGIAPLELFRALAKAACCPSRNDWEDRRYSIGAGLEGAALLIADRLSAAECIEALEFVVGFFAPDRQRWLLRHVPTNQLVVALTQRIFTEAGAKPVLPMLQCWLDRAPAYVGLQQFNWAVPSTSGPTVPEAGQIRDLLRRALATSSGDMRVRAFVIALGCQFLEQASAGNEDATLLLVARIAEQAFAADSRVSRELIAALENAETGESFLLARAWVAVTCAHAGVPAASRGYAQRVEDIAATFLDDRSMQHHRATAWRIVAYAYRDDRSACRGYAQRVEDTAAPFPDDLGIQRERAKAWRIASDASRDDQSGCLGYAQRVEDIAAPFPDDLGIQLERVQAWRMVAHAHRDDRSACCRYAQRVEDIAAPFPDDLGIQRERAKVWRIASDASRDDQFVCCGYAKRVEDIAALFPDDPIILYQCAIAFRNAAYSALRDPKAGRMYARRVEDIAVRFPSNKEIQRERVQAWRFVAAHTEDPVACRGYAQRVEDIAVSFPDDRIIQRQRASAWRSATYAHISSPAACCEYAQRVEDIAAFFPDDRDIQRERAMSWRHAAYAHRDDPAAYREYASKVEDIAARFPMDGEIQDELRHTKTFLAH